jgi:hypothetical protein
MASTQVLRRRLPNGTASSLASAMACDSMIGDDVPGASEPSPRPSVRRPWAAAQRAASGRWFGPTMLGLSLSILLFAAGVFVLRVLTVMRDGVVGIDYLIFVEYGRRWRETGTTYLPYQLDGPYEAAITQDLALAPGMYPPAAGPIFALVSALPAVLWWAIPIGLVVVLLWRWRPAAWAWPLMAAAVAWPETLTILLVGGTTMWIVAGIAAGLEWRWPGALILLKPPLALFALIGIRSRGWWVVAVALVALSLPQAADYVQALLNTERAPSYYLGSLPALCLPIIAWLARRKPAGTGDTQPRSEYALAATSSAG